MGQTIPSQVLKTCKICGAKGMPHHRFNLNCIPCGKRRQVEYVRRYRLRHPKKKTLVVCKYCDNKFETSHLNACVCVDCKKSYSKQYAAANRERMAKHSRNYRVRKGDSYREYMKDRRKQKIAGMTTNELTAFRRKEAEKTRRLNAKLKNEVFVAYGGWRCACCGESERLFLSLDHIDNNGGKLRKNGAHPTHGSDLNRWLKKNGFPAGFQVLCMNCNWGRAQNGGACPHQKRCNDYSERKYGQAAGSAAPLN